MSRVLKKRIGEPLVPLGNRVALVLKPSPQLALIWDCPQPCVRQCQGTLTECGLQCYSFGREGQWQPASVWASATLPKIRCNVSESQAQETVQHLNEVDGVGVDQVALVHHVLQQQFQRPQASARLRATYSLGFLWP